MEISFDGKNIIYLFSHFIGCLVGVILIASGIRRQKGNVFLGFNFLFLTYSSFIIWLITTGYFVNFPQLYRTGNFTGLLFIPLMYLYIRITIKKKGFSKWDLFHFLPAVIFLVDFWPIYQLPAAEKLRLIQSEISNPSLFTQFSQSRLFHGNFYTPFRTLLTAGYWSVSVYLIIKGIRNKLKNDFSKEWFIWIKVFLAFQSLVFLPSFLLNWAINPVTAYHIAHVSIVILTIGTASSLLFFPKILYGLDREQYEIQQEARKSKSELLEQLSPKKIGEIKERLDTALYRDKKFLQQGYTISDLSNDTGIPSYLLTLYINNNLAVTFPELINKERVEECCKMMASGKYAYFATEGFAQLCGFSNRNSFTLAFKKYKGVTPASFLKSLNHSIDLLKNRMGPLENTRQ